MKLIFRVNKTARLIQTSLSGLLQEVEQDGGCLVYAQLLCVLTTGLCEGTNTKHCIHLHCSLTATPPQPQNHFIQYP